MTFPGLCGSALLMAFAVTAVLAPVRFSAAEVMTTSVAECTTCCARPGTLCVVCSGSCLATENAYDNGGGPCQKQH